jgi:hypothetical protein
MKIISYSLYGDLNRYIEPLIFNAINLDLFYSGWQIRVYHDSTVPFKILDELSSLGVKLIHIQSTEFANFGAKFWRFLPVFENDIEYLILRDSDSIFTTREVNLVQNWINSESNFHIIRDHELHISPILAGMFGIKKALFPFFKAQLYTNKLKVKNSYNADQKFLADYIYLKIRNKSMIHTSHFAFFGEKYTRISKCIDPDNFIGAIYVNYKDEVNNLLKYDFIIGIPFWAAKLLRYKIRPVLYLSYFYNLILRIK